MNFSFYKETQKEEWIVKKFLEHSIFSPSDLSIENIASALGGAVEYLPSPSHARWSDDEDELLFVVFLDNRLNKTEIQESFFHELCHPLRHCGNQQEHSDSFKDYQEEDANIFKMYATIPFYMIKELEMPQYERDMPYLLAREFSVPFELAKLRWDQIKRRIYQGRSDNATIQMQKESYKRVTPHDWCPEAKKMWRTAIQRKMDRGQGVIFR